YAPAGELATSLATADVHLISLRASWDGLMIPSKVQGLFAAGRPAILVGSGENEIARWIQEAKSGAVVAVGDTERLLHAVRELLDPTTRQERSTAARAFARDHFDLQTNSAVLSDYVTRSQG